MKSRQILKSACLTAFVTLATIYAASSKAQTVALDFTGGGLGQSNGRITWGWAFNIASGVTVTDLGVYDEGNNGLVNSHQVGLWDSGGTLLATTTLASGLSGTAVPSVSGFGSFRFNNIVSLGLAPGSYVIGAAYVDVDADLLRFNTSAPSMAPGFTFTTARSGPGGFVFPPLTSGTNGFFGPNLRFVAAPEPGTVVSLFGTGALSGALLLRRRKVRSSN
ncbi:MAG: PEP-CTERM sorting domain-containing protein [Chthonomonadales bacterium]